MSRPHLRDPKLEQFWRATLTRWTKYVVRFPNSDKPDQLHIAELPPEALPKSKAGPGLVADVIVSKLVDHLPLHRQELRYGRQGFPIA